MSYSKKRKKSRKSSSQRSSKKKSYKKAEFCAPEINGMDTILDSAVNALPATVNTNVGNCLNLVQQGASAYNRRGNIINLKSLRITGVFRLQTQGFAQAAVANQKLAMDCIQGNTVRLLVIYDSRPGATIPVLSEIIGEDYQAGGSVGVMSPLKMAEMGRFRILRDMKIDLNPATNFADTTGGNIMDHSVDIFVKLKGYQTTFKTQTNPATVANIATGALYCYMRTLEDPNHTMVTMLNGNARLRFEP